MPASVRVIRRRIKSITNTKKITKAMELVAAAKMRRAVSSVLGSRPYARRSWDTAGVLAELTNLEAHPLLAPREKIKKLLCVLITSDRGLCGGFNAQIFKNFYNFIKTAEAPADIITIGKKGETALRRMGLSVVATFPNLGHLTVATDVRPIAAMAVNDYLSFAYDKVVVFYTDYRSAVSQMPSMIELLPLKRHVELGAVSREKERTAAAKGHEYIFEPSPEQVLDQLLPRIIETQIYQAILESAASEQSARMIAMRNASDAAEEMIDDFTFTFNQVRQAGITREIAEISAGRAALE